MIASFRVATSEDADAIPRLHADSWRRHSRGAYSDAFLDGDVLADRTATWRERLREPDARRYTILAESLGVVFAGREPVTSSGGVPGRLHGNPFKLRYAWSDAATLTEP